MSDRTIEHDLKFLIAVLNWAAKSRDERGKLLLASNPLKGLRTPTEKNPTRVVLSEEEYQALLGVSQQVDWRCRVALVLAHETGHRIGAIRQLRWEDIDLEGGVIRWRAEHEKTGYEHRTPVTAEALAALEEARRRSSGLENAPVLPAPRDASQCAGLSLVRSWWHRAQNLAGLEPKRGRGWHSLRRKFASDPHGPATQGPLRTRRLEDRQDGPPVLSAGRRRTASEGTGSSQETSRLRLANRRESNSGNRTHHSRKLKEQKEIRS